MKISDIHLVYFSATYTTRKVVREMARIIGGNVVEHDVTCGLPDSEVSLCGDGDLLIAGAPVYAGRVPARVVDALNMFSGSGTPAVVVCVYGNRDYDDALVELQDTVESRGFKTVAAAAFIGRHCIFPQVAAGRPDAGDMRKVGDFADKCVRLLADTADVAALPALSVKGNRPYKQGGASVFSPAGDAAKCVGCNTCVRLCPVGAIPADSPCTTDGDRCIACGRCVVVCPHGARAFGGDMYAGFAAKFVPAFSARREPETFFP